jgi:hypothetical protein
VEPGNKDRERILQAEMEEAGAAYDRAIEEVKRIIADEDDVHESPNHLLVLQEAIRLEVAASDRYSRAFTEFSQFLLKK